MLNQSSLLLDAKRQLEDARLMLAGMIATLKPEQIKAVGEIMSCCIVADMKISKYLGVPCGEVREVRPAKSQQEAIIEK